MAPHGFFLLERTDDLTLPQIAASHIFTGALNDSGILLQLKDPSDLVQDQVSKWYVNLKDRSSMARVDAGIPGDDPKNWVVSKGTPKQPNGIIGGAFQEGITSPVAVPAMPAPQLQISRFLGNPKGKDEGYEWIEIKNFSSFEANLLGWKIDHREGSSKPYDLFGLIPALGNIRIFSEQSGITLRNKGDEIRLFNVAGVLVDSVSWKADLPDGLVKLREEAVEFPKEALVVSAVDGDTIDIKVDKTIMRVRMIGIDTPESVHPEKPVQRFAKEASAYTRLKLLGKNIRLEYEEEKKDEYGRLLAYVFFDDLFFNAHLIEEGYAKAFLKFPFRYSGQFRNLQEQAKSEQKGLWKKDVEAVEKDRPFPSLREILKKFSELIRNLLRSERAESSRGFPQDILLKRLQVEEL